MLALKEKHNLIYSGYIIVDYSDQVEGPFLKNESTERYSFFGNMLLNSGGELGFHGYNHMPLCLENYNYIHLFDTYKYWPSKEEMGEAIRTIYEFSTELFPDARFSVYVPPSNNVFFQVAIGSNNSKSSFSSNASSAKQMRSARIFPVSLS